MSSNELRRQSKQVKTLCAACQERKAKFRYRGEVRADRDHTLCFECHRGVINRARVRRLTEGVTLPRTWSPFGRPQSVSPSSLNQRQVAHRQRMLDHLRRASHAMAS
jgi:hypothetical protein